MILDILLNKLMKAWDWVLNLKWTSPRVWLSAIAIVILPFTASYYVLTGLLIAMCLSISILFMVEKMPSWMKGWIHNNPLIADLILSTLGVLSISMFVTAGLTLALGFIFLDVILAVTLPSATAPELTLKVV